MPSNICISPLQLLISIFTLILNSNGYNLPPPPRFLPPLPRFLPPPPPLPRQFPFPFPFPWLLAPTSIDVEGAKPGCEDRCGDLKIPYPFGVGARCSFNSSFEIICNGSAASPKAYLSVIDKQVMEINGLYIRVKYPNLVSVCYELPEAGMNVTNVSYMESKSLNLSGTPYTLSYENVITAIGCDDMVMQSYGIGSWVSGGCSAFCADRNDTGGVGYCGHNDSSLTNGCCMANIGDGWANSVAAELIDTSGNLGRIKLFPCSYAFIQERQRDAFGYPLEFSYPLYYLDNSTAFLNDNWASTTNPPVVRLGWSLGSENCSRARLNSSSYACQDNKSVCVDDISSNEMIGYLCRCVEGFEGNPYLPGGCQAISFSSSIVKPGCPDLCGEVSIPFPFGIGPNCYKEPSFEIICNASTYPPRPYLAVLKAEIIELANSSQVKVHYNYQMGLACYNLSDHQHQRGITKIVEQSLIIDFSETQYSLSNDNQITAMGCDDMVVGIVGKENQHLFGGCSSLCWEGDADPQRTRNLRCTAPGNDDHYEPGNGCCTVTIPKGTNFLEANLSDLSGRQWKRRKSFSCSFVFLNSYYGSIPVEYLNNSTLIQSHHRLSLPFIILDWRIGRENCNEAEQNLSTFACQTNSECVDFDTMVGGYLCNCSKGYHGNPYIPLGCQDINECADNTTNPCNSNATCINTQGSFDCLCPKNYYGDGRKDGMGCIKVSRSKAKMMILIGIGSGLGFLLFVLMVAWLYKVMQKRKEKLIKEKFFKRNGGLLLEQHTNEGALGRTKVFAASELVIATDNFNESRILGQGGQGTVYKGMLSDGKIVAIKKSKLVEESQLEQFINEVVILSQINHRHIVKLLGCCLETEVPLLVYEFMPNGTLFDLIHDPSHEFPFPWNMRVKIARDVAGALAYLHSASSMPIYHRDIKSSNLLLDEKYVVKVSDFGTSRSVAVDQTHLTTMVKGTFGYLDPEYFQSSQFTEKSDVYSFGVVLVELLTGQKPISFDKAEEERGLATRFLTSMEENDLDTILDPQVSMQDRKEEVILVARLAQRCLNLKGRMRPSMKEVATELESFQISQMATSSKDELEEVRNFEDIPSANSDIEYTWSTSYKSAAASLSDIHPLMYTSEYTHIN